MTGVRDEAHGDGHFERPVAPDVGVQNVVGAMGHECLVNLGLRAHGVFNDRKAHSECRMISNASLGCEFGHF